MYKLFYAYNLSKILPVGNSGLKIFEDEELRISTDYDFEIHKIAYVATSPSSINIVIANRGTKENMITLNPIGINLTSIAGYVSRGIKPYILSSPYTIKKGSKLEFQFWNKTIYLNTVRLSLHGAKIIHNEDSKLNNLNIKNKELGIYSNSKTISASAKDILTIKIDNDSYFLIRQINGYTAGDCLLNFINSEDNKYWMNNSTHKSNILGTGSFSNNLSAEKLIAPNSTISIEVEDISASSNLVSVSLIGEKIYV